MPGVKTIVAALLSPSGRKQLVLLTKRQPLAKILQHQKGLVEISAHPASLEDL